MQYWNGSAWATVSGGNVTGNNKIWRKFAFAPVNTSKLRILTHASPDGYSRIMEVEAYEPEVTICGFIERLDPRNATGGGGENPLSRNFNWNQPLVSLPGRAGLDLNLTLSYNSLVWTKEGTTSISFDDDHGFPSPGFRLGFPTIQPEYLNAETGVWSYLLIGSDGSRTELRRVSGSTVLYESADSSHLLLDTSGLATSDPKMVLRTTDGTQLTYKPKGVAHECTEIKDRNGNYITINYNSSGRIANIHDTLDRTINFVYENGWLKSVEQQWKKPSNPSEQITHTWASFAYTDIPIQTNFTSGLAVYGPNGTSVKMLSKVTIDDNSTTPAENSHYDFEYTSWGQVWKISTFAADNHLLNYRSYRLPGSALWTNAPAQSDCPRFTERRDWAENWNQNVSGTEQEAVTTYSEAQTGTATVPGQTPQSATFVQVTNPNQTFTKIYFLGTATSSGWRVGLPYLVESYDVGGTVPQRQVATTWTQDDESKSYILNPRVLETNVYDPAGNRKRTDVQYQSYALGSGMSCKLPEDVREYAADAATVLRTTRTTYVDSSAYLERRIIGLPEESLLYEGVVSASNLRSKREFIYDETGSIEGNDAPVQHDPAYSSGFVTGRGNLTTVKRFNVNDQSQFTTSTMKYNTAGAVVSSKDALLHETKISYADSFSDAVARNTLAYPTKVTDPAGYYATSMYNFDFGALTYQQTPPANYTGLPSQQPAGPVQSFEYYDHGQLKKQLNLVNNAYTRHVYEPNGITTHTYATIQEGLGEVHSFAMTDGAGRVIATATDHNPNTFSGQKRVYDVMGRVIKTSNPTETTAAGVPSQWNTTGDDANAGWIYTQQTYDWKGRPLATTNPSMTSNPAETTTKQFSYSGCGCAGGEVVTVTEEGTSQTGDVVKKRQQKTYTDVLGRTVKTEIMNWDGAEPGGTNGTVYSATTFTYNARDQVTLVRQFGGPTSSTAFQDTTSSYDGFGRLKTQHQPEQQVDVNNSASTDHTTWNYNTDDTIQSVVDPRGVVTSFTYNTRRLPTLISFDSSSIPATSGVAATADIAFTYDARGNRTSMSDGSGAVTYHYDQLSRMDWEERSFAGLPNAGVFRLNYEYNLGGILKKVTDVRSGTSFTETLDKVGRVTTVNAIGLGGAETQFISNAQYRAWGALKSRTQGSTTLSLTYNQRLLAKSYSYGGGQVTYEYHNDGSVKFADDQSGFADIKDRAYSYDAAGRLQHAYSGVLARNFVNNATGGTPDGPYDHQYGYDQWGNVLQDAGNFWSRSISTEDSFDASSNRNPLWSYDAAGNILSRNEPGTTEPPFVPARYQYDAAGHEVGSTQTRSYIIDSVLWTRVFVNSQTYDGDGQLTYYALRRTQTAINFPPSSVTDAEAYLLRSSVLGGSVITEYKGDGTWSRTHVYAGSERLGQTTAELGTAQSILEARDPITGDGVKLQPSGSGMGQTTMDPGGVDVGSSDPFPADGSGDPDGLGNELGKAVASLMPIEGFGAKCVLDGLEIDCSRIGGDASVQCPNNECSAILRFTGRRDGQIVDRWIEFAPQGWDPSYDGTYKLDREFGVFRRQGPAPARRNHATPQNPDYRLSKEETTALKGDIADRLSDPNCLPFIRELLAKVASPDNPTFSSNPLDVFDEVDKKGGYNYTTRYVINTVESNLGYPNAKVLLQGPSSFGPGRWEGREEYIRDQISKAGLHETLHLAGRNRQIGDEEFVTATLSIAAARGWKLPSASDTKVIMSSSIKASSFWGNALESMCKTSSQRRRRGGKR